MKKWLIAFLSIITCFTMLFAVAGCKGTVQEQPQTTFVKPELSDIKVDVSDRPEAMLIGDATLNGVTLGTTALSADGYFVREKYFLLNKEYYGDIGLGEHSLIFDFTDDAFDKTIKITVVDEKAPDFDLPSEKSINAQTQAEITLPEITRNRKYQSYEAQYTVKDQSGTVLFTAGDGLTIEKPVVQDGLSAGEYTYTVSVKKGDQELAKQDYILFVGTGDNYFAPTSLDKWTAQAYDNNAKNILIEADQENNAIKVTRKVDNTVNEAQFTSNNNRIYMSADKTTFEQMLEAGYETYTFSYYSELTDGTGNGGYYGFRVYNSTKQKDEKNNKIPTGTQLITVSKNNGNLVNGKWTSVTLDLNAIVGTTEFWGFMLVVCGNADSTILFKNGYFGYKSENIFSSDYNWSIQTPVRFSCSSDTEQTTFKVTNNDASGITLRDSVVSLSTSKLQENYNANKKILTFKVKASGTAQIRIYAKQNSGRDVGAIQDATAGVKQYKDVTLSTEFQTVTVDLEVFFTKFGVSGTNYIGIVLYAANGTTITFADAQFSTAS